jgi:uncharacterized membrane protein
LSDVERPSPELAGEHRWPMAVAVLTAVVLQVVLPRNEVVSFWWLFPVVEVVMLAALIVADPGRIDRRSRTLRRMTILLIAVMTAANTTSGIVLIHDILAGLRGETATILLGRGAAIWVTNVIFSLWYWEFDRGGPTERMHKTAIRPGFTFPEEVMPELVGGWEPTYPDYLYLAFTSATAFSPTDTLPVAIWAKMTMMIESGISLVVAILVVARAVNILP